MLENMGGFAKTEWSYKIITSLGFNNMDLNRKKDTVEDVANLDHFVNNALIFLF